MIRVEWTVVRVGTGNGRRGVVRVGWNDKSRMD